MKSIRSEHHPDDPLLQRLRDKPDIPLLATQIAAKPDWIIQLLEIIRTDPGSIKFYADKVLRQIATDQPECLDSYFDEIASLIDSPNSFIRWGAIQTLGQLALNDPNHQFDRHYEHFFSLMDDPSMITAANVVGQAGPIVRIRHQDEPDITRRLLKVRTNTYWHQGQPSPECGHIICGKVIDCFDHYFEQSSDQEGVLEFVREQMGNPRKEVAKKAARFLKKHAFQ